MATHPFLFNSFHNVSLPILAHFINIYLFHANLISDLNAQGGGRGLHCQQATWTPRVFTHWKMSILSLLNGLDYCIIWWRYVIMCVFHCGIPVYYGDFVFIGYRIFLSNGNMSSYHVFHGVQLLHAGVM